MLVVGFLGTESPESEAFRMAAFRKGLNETGYVEGRNVAFEYRWAHGQYHRLAAPGFRSGSPPGFRNSCDRPHSGSTRGESCDSGDSHRVRRRRRSSQVRACRQSQLTERQPHRRELPRLVSMMAPKRLEILHEAVPNAAVMGFLVNPNNLNLESETSEMEGAAAAIGRKLRVVKASAESDLETAFAELMQQWVGALCVEADQFFLSRRDRLVALAARHGLPAIYNAREYVVAGGLMSYGTPLADAHRLMGIYAGRVLKGEKPADLPVQQSVKVELVINMRSAKTLGLTSRSPFLAAPTR
jgi:putative tryptophan/tyrosine transport system substrate-binding protein